MNVVEIASKYKIPLAKVRKLEKDGLLKSVACDERPAKIKFYMGKGNALTVLQMLMLLKEPAILWQLGPYQERAQSQLAALGDVAAGSFGERAANLIYGAAILEPECTNELASMVRGMIRREGEISYAALAARMLWDTPASRLSHANRCLRPAMANLRKHPDLVGWVLVEGKKTIFRAPEPLDL